MRSANATLCVFLWSLGGLAGPMLYPILPDIADALQETPARVHMTVSLFFAGFALCHLLILPLIGRVSPVQLVVMSLALFAASSMAAATAANIETIIAGRFFQGLAYGALPMAVRDWLTKGRSAEAASRDLALVAGIVFLIPIGTPLMGSVLAERYGWPVVFWLQAAYAVMLLAPLCLLGRPDDRPPTRAGSGFASLGGGAIRRLVSDRPGAVASAQVVVLYSLVMLVPFDIARVVGAMGGHTPQEASIAVAASFAAITLGSFVAAWLRSFFGICLFLTFVVSIVLALIEWVAIPSFNRFAVGTTLISFGLGLTVWTAMSRAMIATDDRSMSRSAILGFVQYAGAFAVVTLASLLFPPVPYSHFASDALLMAAALALGFRWRS